MVSLGLSTACALNANGVGSGGEGEGDGSTTGAMESGSTASLDGTTTSGGDGTSGAEASGTGQVPPACERPTIWLLDSDGDGFGDDDQAVEACEAPLGHVAVGGDCNDDVATAYPGADEICDFVDNDCDGKADEWALTNDGVCNGCVGREQGGIAYYICVGVTTWNEGAATCQGRGAQVASIDSDYENDAIRYLMQDVPGVEYAFIGFNDRRREGQWEWSDDTPVEFELWASFQPDNFGNQDCAVMFAWSGEWLDRLCDNYPVPNQQSDGIVCRDPAP